MEHSKDEILQALKVIQDVCYIHNCKDCPFADGAEVCLITDNNPSGWEIDQSDPVWRALH